METDTRALLDKMFPCRCPGRRRRKLSPIKKRRGGLWNLKPFVTRSNRKRASAVVRLRNKIRMQTPMLGRRFRGGTDLIDLERPQQYLQNTHVYFCGTDKRVYWNAYIMTAQKEFWVTVNDLASTRVAAMLSEEECEREFAFTLIPIKYDAWGRPKLFRLKEKEEYSYPQFDGLSRQAYEDRIQKEIIANEPPPVYESFKIDREFEDGIGLYVVVDADYISKEVVEDVIDRFFALSETDWQSETPVPRERLPYETETEFLLTIPPEKR